MSIYDLGSPSIARDKNGTIYWFKRIDGKSIRRSNKNWKTKKEAKEHYNNFIKRYQNDEVLINRLRFDDLVDLYIEFISLSLKKSTVDSHKSRLNIIRKKYITNVYIDKITPATIQSIQHKMLKDEVNGKLLSNQYLKLLQGTIKSLLDYAVNFDFLKNNPFNQVPLVKHHTFEEEKEMTILTLEEVNAFINANDSIVYKTLYTVLYWCGLRIGEAIALNLEDYNKEDKTLNIYKNYDFYNKELTTTKTEQSRIVSVPDICAEQIDLLIDSYKKSEGKNINYNNPLFKYSNRLPYMTIINAKNRLLTKLEKDRKKDDIIIPYFSPHDLRHTHVSVLIDLGMEAIDISRRLGHSVEMVNNTYGHLFPERKDKLLESLNDISNNIKNS